MKFLISLPIIALLLESTVAEAALITKKNSQIKFRFKFRVLRPSVLFEYKLQTIFSI